MDDRLRELLEEDSLKGDFDAVVDRIRRRLEIESPLMHGGLDEADQIAAAILEKFRGRLNEIPEDLQKSLFELGWLEWSKDPLIQELFDLLSKREKELVNGLESHLSKSQHGALVAALRSGTSLITPRVLAVLSWKGLGNLYTILDKAASASLDELRRDASASLASREAAYAELCEAVPFFPTDPDEWDMEEEEEKTKRRETETALFKWIDFLRHTSLASKPPKIKI